MARKKAFDMADHCCGSMKFRVQELNHLVKKVDNAMAKQLVKKIDVGTKDLCKQAIHLKDIMRKQDPQNTGSGRYVDMGHDRPEGWTS